MDFLTGAVWLNTINPIIATDISVLSRRFFVFVLEHRRKQNINTEKTTYTINRHRQQQIQLIIKDLQSLQTQKRNTITRGKSQSHNVPHTPRERQPPLTTASGALMLRVPSTPSTWASRRT